MAQIDTQAIIDALTLKLRTEYPDAVIDNEEAPQGIRPGAILVNLTNAGQSQLNPHRFHRTPQFDVLYFSDNSNAECAAVERQIEDWGGVDIQLLGIGGRGYSARQRHDVEH